MSQPERTERSWHALSASEAMGRLGSTPEGISSDFATSRLAEFGPNVLEGERPTSVAQLVLSQVANPLVYLLFAAAVVSAFAGKPFDAVVIVIIVLANTVIGAAQEYRAEQALAALRKLASPRARVMRDGIVEVVDATQVVPGDVLVLETGDRVAADARVLTVTDLRIDESALTGESDEIYKSPDVLPEDSTLADRTNMVWSSTPVTNGRATAVVTAIGMETVVGRIALDVRSAERVDSPLQQRLSRLSTLLGIASVVAAVLIFALGVARGESLTEMLLFAVAAAVSVIPEGLPTAVSVALALGVQRMTKRNAIIKRLPAVETLGSTTVICTDKTGTLTRNEMTVTRLWSAGRHFDVTGSGFAPEGEVIAADDGDPTSPALVALLSTGCIANNAVLELEDGVWRVEGNPTEGALFAAARKSGVPSEPRCTENRIDEIPFSSTTKYMATLDRRPEGLRMHVKGAPDRLLSFCDRVMAEDGSPVPLDDEGRAEIERVAEEMASRALRVVAAAMRDMPEGTTEADRADAESGCVFVGMWGLWDPPRDEVAQSVAAAQRAGVAVKMISGDFAATAQAIARRVGILGEGGGATVTGRDLDAMDDGELEGRIDGIAVFARVEPRHKLRIVEALQTNGEIVAMTGDGVNDAPALKQADIGIAMGVTGTEVSKEAADMVLADDDFATIVAAIEEGRVLFGNLRRVVTFLVAVSVEQVLLILASQLIGLPLPITAVMILWVNLVSSSMVTIPLGIEPKHDDVLSRPPRPASEGIIDGWAQLRIIVLGPFVAAAVLLFYVLALQSTSSLAFAQTAAFTAVVVSEWMQALGDRSWTVPLWRLGLRTNLPLLAGIGVGAVLQFLAVSWPPAARAFGTQSLGPAPWMIALAIGVAGLAVSQIVTAVQGRRTAG